MIKALKIKNLQIISRLDNMAQSIYNQPATYNDLPAPNVSMGALRAKITANDGKIEISNTIDWVGRNAVIDTANDLKVFRDVFLGSFKKYTGTSKWYWDTYAAMVPYWGWNGWQNSKGKPKLFIRFIHNVDRGETRFVADKRYKKIPDQHSIQNGDWTCLIGEMNGNTDWMADRNFGKKPRCVIEMAIPSTNRKAWDEACTLVNSV